MRLGIVMLNGNTVTRRGGSNIHSPTFSVGVMNGKDDQSWRVFLVQKS
jgi:hypothetical protein